ncbi:MAG TPA: anti-sigma regulatory factor [Candidatus Binatia bacterium]|jgi:serine/threonine-protein kinase RsbT|nr:anti-sigma regulatory factor [Candidatus Binatia bacterium]
MAAGHDDVVAIRSSEDVLTVRQTVRQWSVAMRFSLVDQTKIVTAASEIGRNTLIYGGGGVLRLRTLTNGHRQGLQLEFEDQGPGIADIALALRDGYTSGSGLGLGLGGAKRLVNDFEISSTPGVGTRIVLTRWR